MASSYPKSGLPMRIQARAGSPAEAAYYGKSSLPGQSWAVPKAIVPGISPSALDDLVFHGGKVVPQMQFQNIFLGGAAAWAAGDVAHIDSAITRVMRHKRLNNVMAQYFPGASVSCDARALLLPDGPAPAVLDEPDVQARVVALFDAGQISASDLDRSIFNLVLPRGTVLKLGASSSRRGLGGYHGSVHIQRAGQRLTLYYSANVYSEVDAAGQANGIPVFDQPWQNVVATLVHELNEFRTDPDVSDAIAKHSNDFLGWMSRRGHEVGDQPIFAAGQAHDLSLVFQQVSDPPRKLLLPVQFMFSNVAHGAEGPIAKPHVP